MRGGCHPPSARRRRCGQVLPRRIEQSPAILNADRGEISRCRCKGHVGSAVYYDDLQHAYLTFMHALLDLPLSIKLPHIMVKTACE